MPTPASPRYILAGLAAITFIAPLSTHMFIPAMPVVKQEFGIGNELAFATLSLTMMTMAFATLIYGGFSDQWGRKRVLLTGLALYTIGADEGNRRDISLPVSRRLPSSRRSRPTCSFRRCRS